jgi:UDP-2-acetamido-2,6-beta-L-arabino-hexul-4-ose reductase
MKVLITGANGFIAKNLKFVLKKRSNIKILSFLKEDDPYLLYDLVSKVDFIFHLAGVNRSENPKEFVNGNEILTQKISDAIIKTAFKVPIIFTSSIHARLNTPYGKTKRNAENILFNLSEKLKIPVHIFRLPNVFGRWSRPNYNSVVSTFCYNIARDIPIHVNNPKDLVCLVYVDDVVEEFIKIMDGKEKNIVSKDFKFVNPLYEITVGHLAKQLLAFKKILNSNISEPVQTGLAKDLYSTYKSYLP